MARVKVKVAGSADEIVNQSVGSVGSVANAQGPLVDGDFPNTTTLAYYHLAGDALADGPSGGALSGSADFSGKGFYSRENVATFDTTTSLSSTDAQYQVGGATHFTVAAWVYKDDWAFSIGDTASYPLGAWTGSNKAWLIETQSVTDKLTLYSSTDGSATGPSIIMGDLSDMSGWHHLTVTYNGTNITAYLDGNNVGSTASAVFSMSSGSIDVGGLAGAAFFSGKISELVFHKGTALTDAQVNTLYSKRFTNHQQIAGGHVLTNESFPFSDLSGKVLYWNLNNTTQLTDGSVNGHDLTNNGGLTFDGVDIFGVPGITKFNNSEYLTSTDPFFNVGDSEFTVGGMFAIDTNVATSYLFTGNATSSDRGWDIQYLQSTEELLLRFADSASTSMNQLAIDYTYHPNERHHIVVAYSVGEVSIYIDGVLAGSAATSNPPRVTTSDAFAVGTFSTDGVNTKSTMVLQDLFFAKTRLTDEDIRKLASSKIDIPGDSIAPEDQSWEGHAIREDGHITGELAKGWLVDKRSDKIYVDTRKQVGEDDTGRINFTPEWGTASDPTFTGDTVFQWSRDKSDMLIFISAKVNTTGTAGTAVKITIPDGKSLSGKLGIETIGLYGKGMLWDGAYRNEFTMYSGSSKTVIKMLDATFADITWSELTTGDYFGITLRVPIAEWQDRTRNSGDKVNIKLKRS